MNLSNVDKDWTSYPKSITVTAYQWEPQVWVSRTEEKILKIWGPMADILHYLGRSLNISINLITPSRKQEQSGTFLPDENDWTGMMGMLHRKEIDMSVTPLLMSEQRMKYVTFTHPVFIGSIKILVGRPEIPQHAFNLFSAFEIEVWLIFISAFFTVAVMKVIQRQCVSTKKAVVEKKRPLVTRITRDMFFTFASLVNQGEFSYIPKLQSGRLLAGIWMYTSLIVMNFYSAKMTSVMAVQKHIPFIERIEDFQNHPEVQPILHRGSNEVDYFKNSKSGPQAEVWRRVKDQYLMHASELYDDTRLDMIEAGKAGVFQEWRVFKISLAKRYRKKKKCKFHATEPYRIVPVSLAFRPDINKKFLEDVNKAVSTFLEGNLIDFIYPPISESLFQRCIDNHEESSKSWHTLKLVDVYAVAMLFWYGTIASTLVLFVEVIFKVCTKALRHKRIDPVQFINVLCLSGYDSVQRGIATINRMVRLRLNKMGLY